MDDCIFCKSVAKTVPAAAVHEDAQTPAFMEFGRVNPGHVLVGGQGARREHLRAE